MSDTPRTDAVWFYQPSDHHPAKVVSIEVAEQLERENNQLRTENAILGPAATNCALIMQERDQLRDELKVFIKAVARIMPPTDCPFCNDGQACAGCLALAGLAGQLSHALRQPITATLI